jgi:hypothetical protein
MIEPRREGGVLAVWSRRWHVNARTLLLACSALAATCSWQLGAAAERADAAFVVPTLLLWGVLATTPAMTRPPVSLLFVLGSALLTRGLLVGSPPLFSDDLYRYLFEGLALSEGHNPFSTPPRELAALDQALAARVNHPEYTSIYPPVALLWFRILAVGGTLAWAQALTALVDVATAGFLWHGLSRRKAPTWPALTYALHPLPAVESAVGAHIDLVAACFLAAALTWPRHGTLWALLGAGVKLLPAAVLPGVWRDRRWRHHGTGIVAAAVVCTLGALPVLDAGHGLFTSFGAYANHWSFNGLAYPLLAPWLGELTRPVLVFGGLCACAYAWWRVPEPPELALAVGSAFLVLSPTVHPWYAIWALLPALMTGRWGWSLAATSLMGSYAVLGTLDASGQWQEGPWLAPLTWGPALVALTAEWATRHRRQP